MKSFLIALLLMVSMIVSAASGAWVYYKNGCRARVIENGNVHITAVWDADGNWMGTTYVTDEHVMCLTPDGRLDIYF